MPTPHKDREAIAADLDSTITAVLANYSHATANNGNAMDMYDVSADLREAVRRVVLASPTTKTEST